MRLSPLTTFMAVAVVVSSFALLCVPGVEGAKGKRSAAFAKYLRKMRESPSLVLELTDETFRTALMDKGDKRDFEMVVLFTAEGQQYGCYQCRAAGELLSDVAQSYLLQRFDHDENPIIFAKADVGKAQNVFGLMGLQTVPHIYHFKARQTPTLPPDPSTELPWMSNTVEELAQIIQVATKIAITPVQDIDHTIWGGMAAAILVAILGHFVTAHWESCKRFPRNRVLWLLVSLSVYGGGIGGMVFCVIRGSPMLAFDRQGGVSIFREWGQDQLVLEGVVVAVIHLLFAASMLLCYYCSSRRSNLFLQYLGIPVCIAVAMFCLERIFELYQMKTRWYQVGTTMPPYSQEFIFGPVRKSSGILKRMMRTTFIFLYEWKNWPNFKKKSLQIFTGYFMRFIGKDAK